MATQRSPWPINPVPGGRSAFIRAAGGLLEGWSRYFGSTIVAQRSDIPFAQNPLPEARAGKHHILTNSVLASVRCNLPDDAAPTDGVQASVQLCFPEAGFTRRVWSKPNGNQLRVGIMVSGGFVPATNSVIDGIVCRHELHAQAGGYRTDIVGIQDGFRAFTDAFHASWVNLESRRTSVEANTAGSMLGTSRDDSLLQCGWRERQLRNIATRLQMDGFDILYAIGGDGTMKAAHAIASTIDNLVAKDQGRRVSVIGIPKTVNNDILWVSQSLGFTTAVEGSRKLVEQMCVDVRSNPRLD